MKKSKVLIFIVVTYIITIISFYFSKPILNISSWDLLRHLVAFIALNSLFLTLLFSSRLKFIDKLFGYDRVYGYHKYTAMVSLMFLLLHYVLSNLIHESGRIAFGKELAGPSFVLFIALIMITLFIHVLKYNLWKLTHKILFVAYIMGLIHSYLSSNYNLLDISYLSIWTFLTSLIGLFCGFYIVFFYEKQFKHIGKVTKVNRISRDVIDITLELEEEFKFNMGQFIFIKFFDENIGLESHPFSISGSFYKNKIIISVKALGDYTTKLLDNLKVDTKVKIDGPYGRVNLITRSLTGNEFNKDLAHKTKKINHEIWISGGIGITPFMSFIRNYDKKNFKLKNSEIKINLYYSYRGIDNAVFIDEIKEFEKNNSNFTFHPFDSNINRFNANELKIEKETRLVICGPKKMIETVSKDIKEKYNNIEINYEKFDFREVYHIAIIDKIQTLIYNFIEDKLNKVKK